MKWEQAGPWPTGPCTWSPLEAPEVLQLEMGPVHEQASGAFSGLWCRARWRRKPQLGLSCPAPLFRAGVDSGPKLCPGCPNAGAAECRGGAGVMHRQECFGMDTDIPQKHSGAQTWCRTAPGGDLSQTQTFGDMPHPHDNSAVQTQRQSKVRTAQILLRGMLQERGLRFHVLAQSQECVLCRRGGSATDGGCG